MYKKGKIYTIIGRSKIDKRYIDVRIQRPTGLKDKKLGTEIIFQELESFEIDGKQISFTKPNNIAVFANIALKERAIAKELFDNFIKQKMKNKNKVDFKFEENWKLYDYFEKIQTALISIYTAIEALSNVTIPNNFSLERINNKKIKETWNKENIERWLSTTDKISEVIPNILKIKSPKEMDFWPSFKKLEEIRNSIIHQKSTSDLKSGDTYFLKTILSSEIFITLDSGFKLIEYFCMSDKHNLFFPLGFNDWEITGIEVDDMNQYFALIKNAQNNI